MRRVAEWLYNSKELILGLFGLGIRFNAQDVIFYGSAFLIVLGILKVTFGVKIPLIKYFEPLIRPLRMINIADNPTKSGEELGSLIINIDKKIGGKNMRDKLKDFMKHKLVANKFSNGSFLVILIALCLLIGNHYLELYENVDVTIYLEVSAVAAAFILRKLHLETNEKYDDRIKSKEYVANQKKHEKEAKLLIKEANKKAAEVQLQRAMEAIRVQNER